MRLEEAKYVGSVCETWLEEVNQGRKCTLVVLGAGQVELLKVKKPWIFDYVYTHFDRSGATIVNTDLEMYEGIDLAVDLGNPESLTLLRQKLDGPSVVLLCNVLEHVPEGIREQVFNCAEALARDSQGLFICTVPFDYPYHPDPLDTMYRPSCSDLLNLSSSGFCFAKATIEASSFYDEFKKMSLLKKIRVALRPFWIFSRWAKYRSKVARLIYLVKPYKISIIALDFSR